MWPNLRKPSFWARLHSVLLLSITDWYFNLLLFKFLSMSRLLEHVVIELAWGLFNRKGILWPFQPLKSKFEVCINTYMHACMHTYIHTCIHTYIRTYIRTYVRTYVHTALCYYWLNGFVRSSDLSVYCVFIGFEQLWII